MAKRKKKSTRKTEKPKPKKTVIDPTIPRCGNGNAWTPADPDALIRNYVKEGKSCVQIGKEMGINARTIARFLKSHGVPITRSHPRSLKNIEATMWKPGQCGCPPEKRGHTHKKTLAKRLEERLSTFARDVPYAKALIAKLREKEGNEDLDLADIFIDTMILNALKGNSASIAHIFAYHDGPKPEAPVAGDVPQIIRTPFTPPDKIAPGAAEDVETDD